MISVNVDPYPLAATPYVETTAILFLHILAAMVTMAGSIGVLVLYYQATAAPDLAAFRSTLRTMSVFSRSVLQPGAGLAGVIGFLVALRYDARGIFSFERQGWLLIAIVLWLVLQVVAGLAVSRSVRADGSSGDQTFGIAEARMRLRAGGALPLVWLTLLLTVAIVFLMVFQPFVR